MILQNIVLFATPVHVILQKEHCQRYCSDLSDLLLRMYVNEEKTRM